MNTGTEPSEFLSVAYRIRAAERRKSVAHGVSRVKYTHLIMLNAWAEQTPLLGKGGVDAPSRNVPVPLKGADGVVRPNFKTISFERTTPSAPIRGLRDIFLKGAATPPLPRSIQSCPAGQRQNTQETAPSKTKDLSAQFLERGSPDAIKCVYSGLHPGLHSIAAPRPNSVASQLLFPVFLHQRGAATVYFLLFTLMLFGFLVMATDFGRLYLIQGELQTAADAAALASAMRLLGTANAALHASDQVTASFDSTTGNDNRFNLRMNQIGVSGGAGLVTETGWDYFSTLLDAMANANGGQSGGIDWSSGAYPKYVRVQIRAQAPVLFVPLLNRAIGSLPTVAASAVAGISAPVCTACGIDGLAVVDPSEGADAVNYGLVPGAFYTLYLTTSQQTPNAPVTPAPLAGTVAAVQYAILDHVPSGPQDLDPDGSLFELGAGGISSSSGLTPPGSISIDSVESGYPNLQGNTTPGTTVGQDILCGLNVRFGVDPSENICGTIDGGEFATLSPLFSADSDLGGETYAAGIGLQDYATEYDGSLRRILTMAVVDSSDSLNVLNFRQFLIEMSATTTLGLDPAPVSGAFRAQYIGAPVPLRCGGVGGLCSVSLGVGRIVLH